MCDFGLDDDIVKEGALEKMLRWHGFLLDSYAKSAYTTNVRGAGKPTGLEISIKDGMVGDSGLAPLNPVAKATNRNA